MAFESAKLDAGKDGDPPSPSLRAFTLLELIAQADAPCSLEQLTRASGLPKPTVHRTLGLLARAALVRRNPIDKGYEVGDRLARLALEVQSHSPQRAARRAILARLVERIGETCNFTMQDGAEVLYVERVETTADVRLHVRTGSRVPLHCTASGKLFLAHLPSARVRALLGEGPLARYTERTTVSVDALRQELREIRHRGISIDVGEYLVGSVCLAVPVYDGRRHICAAIAVHGPAPRMTVEKAHASVPALQAAAEEISALSTVPAGDGAREDTRAEHDEKIAAATAIRGEEHVRTDDHHRGHHRGGTAKEGQPGGPGDPLGAD